MQNATKFSTTDYNPFKSGTCHLSADSKREADILDLSLSDIEGTFQLIGYGFTRNRFSTIVAFAVGDKIARAYGVKDKSGLRLINENGRGILLNGSTVKKKTFERFFNDVYAVTLERDKRAQMKQEKEEKANELRVKLGLANNSTWIMTKYDDGYQYSCGQFIVRDNKIHCNFNYAYFLTKPEIENLLKKIEEQMPIIDKFQAIIDAHKEA